MTIPSAAVSATPDTPVFVFFLREPITWRDKGPLSKCLSNVNSGWLGWLLTPGLLSFCKWQLFGKKHMNLPWKTLLNPSNQTKNHTDPTKKTWESASPKCPQTCASAVLFSQPLTNFPGPSRTKIGWVGNLRLKAQGIKQIRPYGLIDRGYLPPINPSEWSFKAPYRRGVRFRGCSWING